MLIIFSLIYLIAACIPIALILLVLPNRRMPGNFIYIAIMVLSSNMSFASMMQYAIDEPDVKLLWRNVTQIDIFLFPVLSLFLVLVYANYGRFVRKRNIMLALIVPLAGLLLTFTNESHHLMMSSVELGSDGSLMVNSHETQHRVHCLQFLLPVHCDCCPVPRLLYGRGTQSQATAASGRSSDYSAVCL